MTNSFTTDNIAALRCDKCGNDILPPPSDAPDETLIYCLNCGTEGERWADIKASIFEAMTKEFKETATDIFSRPFDGSAGVPFKRTD